MRGTQRRFYVRSGEEVLVSLAPRWTAALVRWVAAATVIVVLALVAHAVLPRVEVPQAERILFWTRVGAIALVVVVALVQWRWWATTEYVVTDQRIYARTGRLRTRVHFTTLDRITDVSYNQGPLDRVAGVGSVTFMTAGGDVSVVGVTDALAVRESAETAREALIERLLERAGVEEAARREKAAPSALAERQSAVQAPAQAPAGAPQAPAPSYVKRGDVILWVGKPRAVAALGAALPIAGALAFFGLSALANRGNVLFLPLLVGLGLALVGFRAFQIRFVEYVVTDKRVYARSGVVGTTMKQLTYDKITDITYKQDVLGRVLGYAGITVNTAGSNEAPVVMMGLWNALDVKELVERARARALHEVEGEA